MNFYGTMGVIVASISFILALRLMYVTRLRAPLDQWAETGKWSWEGKNRYGYTDVIYHDPFDVDVKGWLSMAVAMLVGVLTSSALAIVSGIIWPATLMVAPFFVNACIKRFKVMTAASMEKKES